MNRIFGRSTSSLLYRFFLSSAVFLFAFNFSPLANATENEPSVSTIPAGTILPIRLPAISSAKVKPGETIRARLAQEVLLPGGAKIHARATVLGTVISTTPADSGAATLTIKFDKLVDHGHSIALHTNLRALASPLEVEFAQMPTSGPGESDVYDWLSTKQIGGEVAYGKEGPVEGEHGVVGKSTYSGVFVQVAANSSRGCRGEVAGNKDAQAVWLFSSDACGLYGFPGTLRILHAGRTAPQGQIILESTKGPVHIWDGSGALLRVD
jgi:hypothetical protein